MDIQAPLWEPSAAKVNNSNLHRFIRQSESSLNLRLDHYQALHQWSISKPEEFWAHVWKFCGVVSSSPYQHVQKETEKFSDTAWFDGAKLNFAENLLRHRNDKIALISILEKWAAAHPNL